ncbi:MAG: Fic family protein, partial [Pseudomonadales bacterium]|nr:Fic family protein [Pseudomonadales bacterium]
QVADVLRRLAVDALIIDEIRRMLEVVLARFGLRPSQYTNWAIANKQRQL